MKQRDKMKQLFARYGGNEETIVREYARAELCGEVRHRRHPLSLTPCFSGVIKRQDGQEPFQRFCGRRINR
jgi:hypothetical protein